MHELALCQALMAQVESVARDNDAERITSITLGLGPLSGAEAQLLEDAFPIASAGSIAAGAMLIIQPLPLRVVCSKCGAETEAKPNKLVCGACGDWQTRLISGDELLLVSVELDRAQQPASKAMA